MTLEEDRLGASQRPKQRASLQRKGRQEPVNRIWMELDAMRSKASSGRWK